MIQLNYSYETDVDKAYIITIKNHALSEQYSKICQDSCDKVGMPWTVWDAYDGTGGSIIEPEHSKNNTFMGMIKTFDTRWSNSELSCILSHISLWTHCVLIQKPIVILEHDAIMIKKFTRIESFNSIIYMGGSEWVNQGWPVCPIPPYGSNGDTNCICLKLMRTL